MAQHEMIQHQPAHVSAVANPRLACFIRHDLFRVCTSICLCVVLVVHMRVRTMYLTPGSSGEATEGILQSSPALQQRFNHQHPPPSWEAASFQGEGTDEGEDEGEPEGTAEAQGEGEEEGEN